ncbi:MAG: hypothetical protein MUE81_02345 [Thermoflexibacter sp.]|jgi:hypothetical protein|nr:hypothetical protein [Thermoflexibacter sp.]
METQNEYPSLLKRIQSSIIDGIVLLIAMVALAQLFNQFENFPTFVRIGSWVSLLLYEPICISFGATLGNYLVG